MTYEETENDYLEFVKSAKINFSKNNIQSYLIYSAHVLHETNVYLKKISEEIEKMNKVKK